MDLPIDSEWLRTFRLFASSLNLTRAAEALHLSQPAVHLQIKKLSDALGVPLYRKIGRRLELTDAGLRTAGFAADVDERAATFRQRLRRAPDAQPVVLAAGEGAYLYLLGEGLRAFTARSKSPLRLLTRDREGTLDAVAIGAAQLGVTTLESPPADLAHEPLAEVPLCLVVPARHRLATKRTVRLRELDGARLIVPPPERPHRVLIAQAMRAAGAEWSVAVEATGWELMLRFAALGLGLAIVNGCCAIPRGLRAIPIPELPRTAYALLSRHGLHSDSAAAKLRSALLAATQQWRRRRAP